MTPQNILDITREGLLLVLWISLPVVVVATVTALVVAVLQAVTQVQDQSIGQSIRMIAVMVAIIATAGWLGRDVMRFAERAFHTLTSLP
ncbi:MULTISPECIES: type III secretion system export apparatus subunit SctS [unclassified Variovorax]|jgi:type III secretion protein S|uniref:type III secretion system export apparatus subunit SctS n=1 Tax=unclassified Variovorax TaxID=663243 RepID=UPI00076DC8BE|nr:MULTISPECIES: type III secretion system export apparatus subunit SctS [unclassified Variovorax]KWT98722.1 type III secretion protein, HrpO family [Variovorax sp. WDL1]NDZ16482.1 EscS/YscS/HrcS family type III secretion system export apparatus protein [Variovorax sp. WS11]PNG56214.1 Flagellar biosynthetic protein FliQ [Variovorax sp. B4]PNG57638.1 Flagellar biosynthetic protein FliQ [Variovorax sp. B2]PSL82405.1 EscS/YscS/HrcS family type III secretion system export apparatus protein [Variov